MRERIKLKEINAKKIQQSDSYNRNVLNKTKVDIVSKKKREESYLKIRQRKFI